MFWKKLFLLNIVMLLIGFKIFIYYSTYKEKKVLEANVLKGKIEDLNCRIEDIVLFNKKINYKLQDLKKTLYFKIFKVNFDSECKFLTQNMICNFNTCSICQCEDNEIPLPWKQEAEFDDIDKKIDEKFYKWVEKYNYSSPYWLVENEIDSKNGIFVNLEKNPEAFTGYQGQHIWNAIYNENCFTNNNLICREDHILYKIISGLHSNINAHLSKNYMDLNKNITFFNSSLLLDRVLTKSDRINNLFFLFSLLLRALHKSEDMIKEFNIYTGNDKQDNHTKELILDLYNDDMNNLRKICNKCFSDNEGIGSLLNLNKVEQLKNKFRNISQIIDCVSCQKCKLHGKLQIYGLATMFKVLFSANPKTEKFKRNEIISFINLVGKVSNAINYSLETIETEMNYFSTFWLSYLETFIIVFSISILIKLNMYFIANKEKYSFNKYDKKLKMIQKISDKKKNQ